MKMTLGEALSATEKWVTWRCPVLKTSTTMTRRSYCKAGTLSSVDRMHEQSRRPQLLQMATEGAQEGAALLCSCEGMEVIRRRPISSQDDERARDCGA